MKLKRLLKPLILIFSGIVLFMLVFNNPFKRTDYDEWQTEITDEMYEEALAVIQGSTEYITRRDYVSYLQARTVIYGLTDVSALLFSTETADNHAYEGIAAIDLEAEGTATYRVDVPTAGMYHVVVDYYVGGEVLNNLTLSLRINDELPFDDAATIDVPLVWCDSTKDFTLDTYGDESLPEQLRVVGWRPLSFYNNTYPTTDPVLFEFTAGNHEITIENVMDGAILLGDLKLVAPVAAPSYEAYASLHLDQDRPAETVEVDAISYIEKNSSYVRLHAFQSPSVTPFDSIDKKLNVINGSAWYRSGQEVTYEFSVPATGNYRIALHYLNDKNEFSVFRAIAIDGAIPFEELKSYEFGVTGADTWANLTLGDLDGFYDFYLTAGTHTISLRAVTTPVADELRDIQLLVDHINAFALNILKITGANIDIDRKWEFTHYIEETPAYLDAYITIVKHDVVTLSPYSELMDTSATLSYLKSAVSLLEEINEDPDVIPLFLGTLYSGVGSVTQMLGDSITAISRQPLYLDAFYIHNDAELENANAGGFAKFGNAVRTFAASFTKKKYVTEDDPEAVNVWVNRSLIYVDLMQKMADAAFEDTDTKIKISIMPDANKLILANAAGKTPDIALGLASYQPFDLALRGALQDLSEFEDFWTIAGDFAPGAFIPYIIEDGVYAMPETLEFHALVYRQDTLRALGIGVPDTWEDVIDMLPTLQRYGMNFFYPTSGGSSMKWFYQTSSLIYQYGGSVYASDGLSTTIDSERSYQGLKLLSDLYTTYSLPSYVGSFYNSFRYNTLPIGIIDFGTYLTLKNAAPELTGQWALALYPGVENDEGEVQRWYIANGSGAIMFKLEDEVKKAASWEFMKWWLSAQTQTNFAFALQSTYGPEFVWLSGNIEAVENSPIDSVDKAVILEMVKWLADVPRTPGQYLLERGLSDIWNTVTFDGTPVRVAIDDQVLKINREIKKKMVEFGYLDENGNVLVPYTVRGTDWILSQIALYGEGDD
ncbi:MAG: extracellular solute-binding protein [Bacillota bacterium]|nr:extracellular solute-binding protein [Bacillota bacterium]